MNDTWGWAGSVEKFLSTPREVWLASLESHHNRLWNEGASRSQRDAWTQEYEKISDALKLCLTAEHQSVQNWSIIFEYELPMEGGRRPDVVILAGASIVVLEFKSSAIVGQADVDQVVGYVRDLSDYHSGSAEKAIAGMVVLTGASPDVAKLVNEIPVVGSGVLHHYIYGQSSPGVISLDEWLESSYRPLPTLVEAARKIFRDEELPHVKTAIAAGIPQTVELLGSIIDQCAIDGSRSLSFVTGVPGAGKTLVGLRLVHDRTEKHGRATFLSGNGPLVQVLQDALASRVFVRDLHAFIKTYALNKSPKAPDEHIIVFDEAQRAWDAKYHNEKKNVNKSEPELLISIGERIDQWSALVGLVGEGQEIHSGEEAGIGQWNSAVCPPLASLDWTVHCPPKLKDEFPGISVVTHDELDLDVTLRSRRAEDLHLWVKSVLAGDISEANQYALKIHDAKYPIYLTRSIAVARNYVRTRYDGEPTKRFGLIASSQAKNLIRHGIDNGFQATSTMNIAKWYNSEPSDSKSSNQLLQLVTEFGCQGLELDLPVLCWGEDFRWNEGRWTKTPVKRKYKLDDPAKLLTNSYRVLMTRGRDGLVIFIPPDENLNETEMVLLASGVKLLLPSIAA